MADDAGARPYTTNGRQATDPESSRRKDAARRAARLHAGNSFDACKAMHGAGSVTAEHEDDPSANYGTCVKNTKNDKSHISQREPRTGAPGARDAFRGMHVHDESAKDRLAITSEEGATGRKP